MKNTENIRNKIERLPKGYVFTYSDFLFDIEYKEAVIKALNRMAVAGSIRKISKGRFYKPEITIFGELKPSIREIVKDLLIKDGKVTGYITGYSIYNELGLTTQLSSTIQIGRNEVRSSLKRDIYTISFIKQKNKITKDKIPLFQILDSIRFIKKIPDVSITQSCSRFIKILEVFPKERIIEAIKLSMKYPPYSRALLGAILDESNSDVDTASLQASLNFISIYKIPEATKALKYSRKWNLL